VANTKLAGRDQNAHHAGMGHLQPAAIRKLQVSLITHLFPFYECLKCLHWRKTATSHIDRLRRIFPYRLAVNGASAPRHPRFAFPLSGFPV